jgi:hypothetical protein
MSNKSLSDIEKFVRWYVTPVTKLREIPNGDGAFIALSVAFSLFERYYRIKSESQETDPNGGKFRKEAAKDLNVNTVFFTDFWSTYRNGLLHQGTPKIYKNKNRKHKWLISGEFDGYPTYFDKGGYRYICIDPWKFYDFIVDKIFKNRKALRGVLSYRLGKIYDPKMPPSLTSVAHGQKYR